MTPSPAAATASLTPAYILPPQVRAGVRNPEKADTFLEIASSYGLLSKDELGRLTVGGRVCPLG